MKAHITQNADGVIISQAVAEHCRNTAEYASEIMQRVGLGTVGYMSGLYHDIGKNKKFEVYLKKAFNGEPVQRGSVNHTFAGVIKLLRDYHSDGTTGAEVDRVRYFLAEIMAFSVGAHHAMFDMGTVDDITEAGIVKRYTYNEEKLEYDAVLKYFYSDICTSEEEKALWFDAYTEFTKKYAAFFTELKKSTYVKLDKRTKIQIVLFFIQCLMRHLLSAVVDGDRQDTQEFMEQVKLKQLKMDWEENLNYFNDRLKLLDKNNINETRQKISDILYMHPKKAGTYLLTLPTGSGKTLSAVRYALRVARDYGKDRIFYVAPLLSILQQNSDVIKQYLKDSKAVLEHYSDIIVDKAKGFDYVEYKVKKSVKQTWNSPFIITTLYQFLETCFKDGLTQVRRFNKLANSVLIIDEIQQIPLASIRLFNLMINYLASQCNVTVILMTATQPHFELDMLKYPIHIDGNLTDYIVKEVDLERVFESRVQYDVDLTPITNEQQVKMLLELSRVNKSVLLICNTRKSCRDLYDLCCKVFKVNDMPITIYRLSRNMCEAEIADTLKAVKGKLLKGERVVCISTQLIEAGVDISFEAVVRVVAGLDNIVQSAGRCNRHNTMTRKGIVYVRRLKNENISALPDIVKAQLALAEVNEELSTFKITDALSVAYYKRFYANSLESLNPGETGSKWLDNAVWSNRVQEVSGCPKFLITNCMKTFGEQYTVYATGVQITVLVPYGIYKEAVEKLKTESDIEVVTNALKKLGAVTVTIYETKLKKYEQLGVIKKYEFDNQFELYIADEVDFETIGG